MISENKISLLNIPIAGLTVQLKIDKFEYYQNLKNKYFFSLPSGGTDPEFTIDILKKDIKQYSFYDKYPHSKGIFPYPSRQFNFTNYAYSLIPFIQQFVINYDILFLHASSIEKNAKGYIFCGPSGIGKSTMTKNVQTISILSDDVAVIRRINSKYYIYQSPFDKGRCSYPYNYDCKKRILIEGIYLLKQAKKSRLVKTSMIDAFNMVLYNTHIVNFQNLISRRTGIKIEKKIIHRLNKLVFNLVSSINTKQLLFTKETSFIKSL